MTLDDKETHSGEANQDPTGPIMPWSHSNLPRRLVPSSQRLTPCCCRVSSKLSSQFSWDGWGKLQGRKPETFLGDKHRPSAWKRFPFVYTIYIDINWFSYIYTIIIYVYIYYTYIVFLLFKTEIFHCHCLSTSGYLWRIVKELVRKPSLRYQVLINQAKSLKPIIGTRE